MGLLIHGSSDGADRTSYQKVVASIRKEHPKLIDGMLPKSANDVRGLLRAYGLEKPAGIALSDLPIVKLDNDFWRSHFDMFASKMMLALHYQCFGTSLSDTGRLWYVFHTNADRVAGRFPKEFLDTANLRLNPIRNKKLLSGQFDLIWQSEIESKSGVWSFSFHNKIAFSGITSEAPEMIFKGIGGLHSPLPW